MKFYFDSDAIAAEWVEAFVTNVRIDEVAVVARVAEVVQESVAVERDHTLLSVFQKRRLPARFNCHSFSQNT